MRQGTRWEWRMLEPHVPAEWEVSPLKSMGRDGKAIPRPASERSG